MSAPAEPAQPPRFAAWAPIAALLVMLFGVSLVAMTLRAAASLDGEGDDLLSPTGQVIATYAQDALLVILAFAFARVTVLRVTLATFGWTRPPVDRRLWLAPLALAAFMLFLVGFSALAGDEGEQTILDDLGARDTTTALAATAVLVCIVAPIAEELFFRGFLFPALSVRPLGWIGGALLSGAIFGGIHFGGTDAVLLIPLAVFGVVLAALYHVTGSLLPSMAVHAFNNGLTLGVEMDWSPQGVVASCLLAPLVVVSAAWAVSPR